MKDKDHLKRLIDVGCGRIPADLCIKNARVVDVYNLEVFESDIYIVDGIIAGFGGENFPEAKETFDAGGGYIAPGLIDAHVHIESSHLSPPEFSRLVVPHGTTTVVADPHEICNVCGLEGLDYMLEASKGIALNAFYQIPSCVPATPFENAGACLGPEEIGSRMDDPGILGLGELMNYVGTCMADDTILDKIMKAREAGKIIDGHSPGLHGSGLDAYAACGAANDHECTTTEELSERIRRGMYVFLREGTLCHDEVNLLSSVNQSNFRFCAFCTDDRQPTSIVADGHIDNNVRIAVKSGVDPIMALSMATVNAAMCFGFKDRGGVVPGKRADLILVDDLRSFKVKNTWIGGSLVAADGKYLANDTHASSSGVRARMNVKDFSRERLKLHLQSDKARAIRLIPNAILTKEEIVSVDRDKEGCWVRNSDDIVKIAVIERHKGTGNVGLGLIKGLGLKGGALASTIAHDSHNIIVAGDSDEDMEAAVNDLIRMGGGVVVAKEGAVIARVENEIAGLMSDSCSEELVKKIENVLKQAWSKLSIPETIDPLMTLCFMALPVIPDIKLTDMGLFDVTEFRHISVEAE